MTINWTPFFHSKVVGLLHKLPEKAKELFWQAIEELKKNPHHQNATQRGGYTNVFDLPVDGYTLVYEIQDDKHAFRVLDFILP